MIDFDYLHTELSKPHVTLTLLHALTNEEVALLLEIINARRQAKQSNIFCSQFNIDGWYEKLGDGTLTEAISTGLSMIPMISFLTKRYPRGNVLVCNKKQATKRAKLYYRK